MYVNVSREGESNAAAIRLTILLKSASHLLCTHFRCLFSVEASKGKENVCSTARAADSVSEREREKVRLSERVNENTKSETGMM